MHAASLSSPRLRRVLEVLSAGRPMTTRQILRKAHVAAVNSCVAELRANGAEITCKSRRVKGELRFYYTLKKAPDLS